MFFFPHLEDSLPTECKHSVAFLALHNIAKQREWSVVDNYVNDDITNQIVWLYSRCDLDIPLEEHINTYKSHMREVMFSVRDVWCESIRKRIDRQAKSQDIKYTLESLRE